MIDVSKLIPFSAEPGMKGYNIVCTDGDEFKYVAGPDQEGIYAAAPDLLEALTEQDRFLGVLSGTVPLSEKDTHRRIQINREGVRAAIAKATGSGE